MKIRLFIFLSALPFMLLGMPGAVQAQQQETGPAGRRVIIFVWDGLRADELTPALERATRSGRPACVDVVIDGVAAPSFSGSAGH